MVEKPESTPCRKLRLPIWKTSLEGKIYHLTTFLVTAKKLKKVLKGLEVNPQKIHFPTNQRVSKFKKEQ